MSLTALYLDTEIKQAELMSRLSGQPAQVAGDIFVWNGKLVDRASAVVSLLKVYNQVPVSISAKRKLYDQYSKKFINDQPEFVIESHDNQSEIWFYKLCKRIQGQVQTRTHDEVKQILISLHRN